MAANIDEQPQPGENPIKFVKRIAKEKGEKTSLGLQEPHILIAADTIVVDGDRLIGKPINSEDAKRILSELAGKTHRVITALYIKDSARGTTHVDLCETSVPMRKYTSDEIDNYIGTGSPLDKAGAYGIQDEDFHPVDVEIMRGCYANVMGLPLCYLSRSMAKNGFQAISDVPAACQSFTNYHCDVFPDILRFQA